MKRKILTMILFSIILSSCKNDNTTEINTPESKTDLIIGTWNVTKNHIESTYLEPGESTNILKTIFDSEENKNIEVCSDKPLAKETFHYAILTFNKTTYSIEESLSYLEYEYSEGFSNNLNQECDNSGQKEINSTTSEDTFSTNFTQVILIEDELYFSFPSQPESGKDYTFTNTKVKFIGENEIEVYSIINEGEKIENFTTENIKNTTIELLYTAEKEE